MVQRDHVESLAVGVDWSLSIHGDEPVGCLVIFISYATGGVCVMGSGGHKESKRRQAKRKDSVTEAVSRYRREARVRRTFQRHAATDQNVPR